MREGDLTYDDFLQRLNIQDVLIDAGYHLNRRDGLRYPSYCLLYTSPSPRDRQKSRMPSSA